MADRTTRQRLGNVDFINFGARRCFSSLTRPSEADTRKQQQPLFRILELSSQYYNYSNRETNHGKQIYKIADSLRKFRLSKHLPISSIFASKIDKIESKIPDFIIDDEVEQPAIWDMAEFAKNTISQISMRLDVEREAFQVSPYLKLAVGRGPLWLRRSMRSDERARRRREPFRSEIFRERRAMA